LDVVEYPGRSVERFFCRSLRRVLALRRVVNCLPWGALLALVLTALWLWPGEASDCPYESYAEWCAEDDTLIDGYWQWGYWVPGLVRRESQFLDLPLVMEGRAVWYEPQVMEATAEARGLSLHGYLDGVASMSCADVGLPYWVNRGYGWEGPFLVVDCAQLDDVYSVIVHREEVVEVGWETAERWGIQDGGWQVTVSRVPPGRLPEAVILAAWFQKRVEFYERALLVTLDARPIYRSPSTWRINGTWQTFERPTLPSLAPSK